MNGGEIFDLCLFVAIMVFISAYGLIRARIDESEKSATAELVGSNVSVLWVALSVCSTFISAISILGFPSEVYYRGTMIYYYLPMYCIAYPICAYVFLPVFYELKLKSLYEYLEKRFCMASRLIASATFAFQTLLYESAALYAPAIALTSLVPMNKVLAIALTASLSAIYLFVGGARAGIYTSSLQMVIIFFSLLLICVASMIYFDVGLLATNASHGGRLIFDDYRLDVRIRHSAFALIIGGCGNIFSLYATNQLTVQRYLCLPTLKKAQKAILLNVPMNGFILTCYVLLGLIIYGVYHGCHPSGQEPNKLVTDFIDAKLNWIPGIEGIFLAALYSAGVSTLTASYNALTAITIEDLVKMVVSRTSLFRHSDHLNEDVEWTLAKCLPFCFAICATFLAFLLSAFDTIILQIALSIFGSLGGTILGVFCVGLFCPWIKSSAAAVCGQLSSLLISLVIASGSIVNKVKPINLPLVDTCPDSSVIANLMLSGNETTGTVTSDHNFSMFWSAASEISYQYYSIVGVLVCLLVAHIIELIVCITHSSDRRKKVDARLLATFMRPLQPRKTVASNLYGEDSDQNLDFITNPMKL